MSDFDQENGRYKIFANKKLREVATARLVTQAVENGLARPELKVEYWLVAGHVANGSRAALSERFRAEGWELRSEEWIKEHLANMAGDAYEDDVATMVAKLLPGRAEVGE